MAERMMALSIANLFDGDHNHPDIPRFISEFSNALYTGDGKMPQMLTALNLGPDFPLRILVGIPKKDFSREKRLIAETFCTMVFGRKLGDTQGFWSHGKGWRPTNPKRVAAPVADCVLDTEWMLSLGVTKSIWRNNVLYAPTAFDGDGKRLQSTTMRHLFALAAFGFSDPYQFFTAATAT